MNQTLKMTDMAEVLLDTVTDVDQKQFNSIVRAKGKQLFGDFYFYAAVYNRSTGAGSYVISRKSVKNLAQVLEETGNYYYQNGLTYYLIEGGRRLVVAQELPEGYEDIETANFDHVKKPHQLKFSVSHKMLLPYVGIFAAVFIAVVGLTMQTKSQLADIEKQIQVKRSSAPVQVEKVVRLPELSDKLVNVAKEMASDGYIEKVELSGTDKLRFFVGSYSEDETLALAKKMKGEYKDGQVQFVR